MAEITYHSAACAMAGLPAQASRERSAILAERQRQLGVLFPAAVVEWYAVDGAVEFQAAHTDDHVMGLDELGLPYFDDDYVAEGLMLITNENQDCYTLVVPLGGSADPPVQLMDPFDLELAEAAALREPFADTFGDYVRASVWDAVVQQAPQQRTLDGVPFSADVLDALRTTADEEAPATGLPGDRTTYRWGFGGCRLTAAVHGGEAVVHVGADTRDRLDGLLGMLTPLPRH